jgi:uncharacterized protein
LTSALSPEEASSRYRALREKVDHFFLDVRKKYPTSFQCGSGCHSCCQPNLSVSPLEANFLKESNQKERALANEQANPFGGTRCSFLNPEGLCLVYEQRPLLCRSHGLPLSFLNDKEKVIDVCSLNFADLELEHLPGTDFLNLDLINTLLNLLNKSSGHDPLQRIPLSPAGIWSPKGTSEEPEA